jgi:putative FmdB family regulatory protein
MPLYEFYCRKCQKPFDVWLSMKEHEEAKPPCPKGHQPQEVEPRIAETYVKTARKS